MNKKQHFFARRLCRVQAAVLLIAFAVINVLFAVSCSDGNNNNGKTDISAPDTTAAPVLPEETVPDTSAKETQSEETEPEETAAISMHTEKTLPHSVYCGKWPTGHVQGIAVDTKGEYIYYSFTTILVKTDIKGNVIGTVEGFLGHLGCLDFNDQNGKVYGSLELKHDAIGSQIMDQTGVPLSGEDVFYVAIFDVDKIDRIGMDPEKDGIMKAVYISEVHDDFMAFDGKNGHKYGCAGMDGVGFGPVPGSGKNSKSMLMVAYGIYGDTGRTDNDHQVLLCFDWRKFEECARAVDQLNPHHSGVKAEAKYFLYTGNTNWGIQNIEYDAYTGDWYVAVYIGKKPEFPNYNMFVIDGAKAPYMGELKGRNGERGLLLSLKQKGEHHLPSGTWGYYFTMGSTGMHSFGNGLFYMAVNSSVSSGGKNYQVCTLRLVRVSQDSKFGFETVK